MGVDPNKPAGLSPYCKVCINEQVKRGIRTKKLLPTYQKRIRGVPEATLQSEIEFLTAKLEIVTREIRRRG